MATITIIEDEKDIRDELIILLENTNYQVQEITNFENIEHQII